jgi:hypothetical protein
MSQKLRRTISDPFNAVNSRRSRLRQGVSFASYTLFRA